MTFSNFSANEEKVDMPVILNYLNIVVGLAAIIVNLLAIYAYSTDREIRRVPENLFIFCLSISDEFTGITLLIHFIWLQNGAFLPMNANIPCFLWGFLTYTSILSSVYLVILISWDRLQMVTHPFKHRQFTRRRAVVQVAVLWICLLTYEVTITFVGPLIVRIFYNREIVLIPCIISTLNFRLALISIVLDFGIPLTVLAIINGLIVVRFGKLTFERVERQRVEVSPESLSTSSIVDTSVDMTTVSSVGSTKTVKAERKTDVRRVTKGSSKTSRTVCKSIRKTVHTLFLFVIVYILCWLPLYLGFIIKSFMDVSPWVIHLLFFVVGINSVINPFMYAFMSNKYRNRLTLMLQCRVR